MDWLKSVSDWLHTPDGLITVTIIILTALITAVAINAVPALGKLIWKFPRYLGRLLKRGWAMLRNWWYWIHYQPKYKVEDAGKIRIEKIEDRYKMSLPITLSFENRDDLESIIVDCKEICLNIRSPKMTGRKRNYKLTYGNGTTVWNLSPLAKVEKADYILTGWGNIEPRLGSTALCTRICLGTVTLKGQTRVLKVRDFETDVD